MINLKPLTQWFEQAKRALPWRENPSPYAVLVSEIMLQQTQVAVVLPFFQKWMKMFPNIETLANACEESVLKCWEGLGYYSRARNLHLGAKDILTRFNGAIPQNYEELISIKGIGPYTAGAILSFAYKKKAAAVDGNVSRVISRLLAIDLIATSSKGQKAIYNATYHSLPETSPWIAMEGLIELGATICSKKPKCAQCPLKNQCKAHLSNTAESFPKLKPRPKSILLERQVWVIQSRHHILIERGKKGEVMEGLYFFPYSENSQSLFHEKQLFFQTTFPKFVHTFTRYRAELFPKYYFSDQMFKTTQYEWHPLKNLSSLPFCSGHRSIAKHLMNVSING